MLIKTIPVGQLEENCYVVTNEATLECVVIDPGDEANTILDYLESNKLKCVAIMLTHGHFDHVGAVDAVAEETGATVYMNELDDAKRHQNNHSSYTLRDGGIYYSDGDVIDALDVEGNGAKKAPAQASAQAKAVNPAPKPAQAPAKAATPAAKPAPAVQPATGEKLASEKQLELISNLYSQEEINGMVSRMGLTSLSEVTLSQASKMIEARKKA